MFRITQIRYLCTPRQMPILLPENIKKEIIEKKNKKNTQSTSSYEYMYKALLDYKRRFN